MNIIKKSVLDQAEISFNQGTILDYCEGFLLDRRAQQLSPNTISFYSKKLRGFLDWCSLQEITNIESVTPEVIRKFLVYLEGSHNRGGIIDYLKTLRALFNWCESEAGVPSPMRKIKNPKGKSEPLEPASMIEIQALIKNSNPRDKAILLVLLDTGIRATELINLNVDDINLITGVMRILHGKGNKPRTVYIGRRTRQALRSYISHQGALFQTNTGDRLTYWGLREIIRRRSKDTGIKPPALHSFRRLHAITMLRNGVDIYSLSVLMGHADIQVLRYYLKLNEGDTFAAHLKGSPVDNM